MNMAKVTSSAPHVDSCVPSSQRRRHLCHWLLPRRWMASLWLRDHPQSRRRIRGWCWAQRRPDEDVYQDAQLINPFFLFYPRVSIFQVLKYMFQGLKYIFQGLKHNFLRYTTSFSFWIFHFSASSQKYSESNKNYFRSILISIRNNWNYFRRIQKMVSRHDYWV